MLVILAVGQDIRDLLRPREGQGDTSSTGTLFRAWTRSSPCGTRQNPNIQVETKNISNDQYGILSNALKAGKAPDLSQVGYDEHSPNLRTQSAFVDASACSAATAAKSKFVPWTWSQASFGDTGVFAMPQDTGPMALYVRSDIFKKYDIAIPTTWDEYAAAAAEAAQGGPEARHNVLRPEQRRVVQRAPLAEQRPDVQLLRQQVAGHGRLRPEQAGRRLLAEADRRQARAHRPRQRFDADVRGVPEGPDRQLRRRRLGLQHVPRQPPQAGRQVDDRPDADVGFGRCLR
ncbi:extracellular solute-binding protein [Streptomyces sp. L7]